MLRDHIEKIISLTDSEYELISSFFTERKFLRRQFVIQPGNAVPYDNFVISGLLKSYFIDHEGKVHILQFASEDWWITDPLAFHFQQKATLNVDCIEDVTMLSISFDARERLCQELPKMESFFRKKTTYGYVSLYQRILALLSMDAEERYQRFAEQYPGFIDRVPKTLLAAYLGVTRETLSRIRP